MKEWKSGGRSSIYRKTLNITDYDFTIIGAGPAGMSGAITARKHNLRVLLLEEQLDAGGQIFRNIETLEKNRHSEFLQLGDEYESGYCLVKKFNKCGADFFTECSVWQVDRDLGVHLISTCLPDASHSHPS